METKHTRLADDPRYQFTAKDAEAIAHAVVGGFVLLVAALLVIAGVALSF